MYRTNERDFPSGMSEGEYRRRMELSYPIHPELFDRLFTDWSTLDKFQRTRGVLRFMALAISQLWQRGDQSLMIMPGNLPMDSGALVSELKKYLEEGWDPVIKSDVDGENALPMRIDKDNKHFGRISATRRVARAVYMGSAPRPDGSRGVDIKSIVLGCVQPGEPVGQFADALKRLSGEATHLYVDGSQYWYSLQPNVTRIAADRAASNYSDDDADHDIRKRLLAATERGAFVGVHVFPEGPGDVPDEDDGVRLVVLPPAHFHIPNTPDSPAVVEATALLAQRSAGPRLHRNLLVFVAASGPRLSELRSASRMYLAWQSINEEADGALNLTAHQKKQAVSKLTETNETVAARIEETFVHVLTPKTQPGAADLDWEATKPSGYGTLAGRVANKLKSEEKLISAYGGVRVRMDLDRVPLWSDAGDVTVSDLWSAYANHPYMARLASFDVLADAISNGAASISWESETFAYAEAKTEETWVGITTVSHVSPTPSGFLLRPDVVPADEPLAAVEETDSASVTSSNDTLAAARDRIREEAESEREPVANRFYARFDLDPVRGIRQLEEILTNVSNHLGENVRITIELEADSVEGFDDKTRRIATENAKQLGAGSVEFE